jgi:ubiquinone/menaquinone biosynthesis C-methylase UbiE
VTDQTERYDRIAAGYARWWAPVLAPAVAELLDEVSPRTAGNERIVDIGTGTGQLAIGVLQRWPATTVAGVDASSGMLAVAETAVEERFGPSDRSKFEGVNALADRLPFDDGVFDLALSSFVLQLVPNRARALREARRVLRPDGLLAYVSWLDGDRAFRPDQIYDEVLEELGLEARWPDDRPGDIPSIERAAGEMRRAGFARVTARPGWLTHRYTIESFISFLTEFDEETYIGELEPDVRKRLLDTLRLRLEALSEHDMTVRYQIVFVAGHRSR